MGLKTLALVSRACALLLALRLRFARPSGALAPGTPRISTR